MIRFVGNAMPLKLAGQNCQVYDVSLGYGNALFGRLLRSLIGSNLEVLETFFELTLNKVCI